MKTYIIYNANTEKTYGRRTTLEQAIALRDCLIGQGVKGHEIVIYEAKSVYPLGA